MNTDESSDNEPLIKIAKVSSKAAKKLISVPPKKSVDKKKQGKIFFFRKEKTADLYSKYSRFLAKLHRLLKWK